MEPLIELWDVTEPEIAFGATIKWPDRRDKKLDDVPREFKDMANTLFFKGGSLADFGLTLRSGVDKTKFYGCLRACLCSFEPPHEVKQAVCGSLIQTYAVPIEDETASRPTQAAE